MLSGLWVDLVLVQSDYNKTELPAETQAVEIINRTPTETHGVTEDYNSLWNAKSADMSLCLSSGSHVAELPRGRDRVRWEKHD